MHVTNHLSHEPFRYQRRDIDREYSEVVAALRQHSACGREVIDADTLLVAGEVVLNISSANALADDVTHKRL